MESTFICDLCKLPTPTYKDGIPAAQCFIVGHTRVCDSCFDERQKKALNKASEKIKEFCNKISHDENDLMVRSSALGEGLLATEKVPATATYKGYEFPLTTGGTGILEVPKKIPKEIIEALKGAQKLPTLVTPAGSDLEALRVDDGDIVMVRYAPNSHLDEHNAIELGKFLNHGFKDQGKNVLVTLLPHGMDIDHGKEEVIDFLKKQGYYVGKIDNICEEYARLADEAMIKVLASRGYSVFRNCKECNATMTTGTFFNCPNCGRKSC